MRKIILFLSLAFITFLCLMTIGHYVFLPKSLDRVQILNDGWDVRYNDTEFKNIRLSDLRELIGSGTFKGDTIVLSRNLEDLRSYTAPTIMFESLFSAIRVYCNGEVLFEYYHEPRYQGKFIGCENVYAPLPSLDGTTAIDIELSVTQDDAYSYYEPAVFGDYTDVFLYMMFNHLFVFITSAFLIIFGLLFFTISLGFRIVLPEFKMQIYSSLLFISLGIWFLAQFRLLDQFVDTKGHQTEIEYIALYLTVPLMYLVVGSVHNFLKNRLFFTIAAISSFLAMLPIVLHFAGVFFINRALILFQINGLILFIVTISFLIMAVRKKQLNTSQYIQLVGQLLISVSLFFNVFFYHIERMGIYEQIMLSKKAVPMGALCMVFATLVNYCIYIAESFARKKEYESLAHLAYADGLTDLPNRSRFEKYLEELSAGTDDYCIISIDLNGLKGVNDKQGHLMGDRYLKDFSRALDSSFRDRGFVARIGGDEFVAILKDDQLNMAQACIDKMESALEDMNRTDPSIRRSAATGFAFRHETDGDSHNAVYLLADERMYEKKAVMHNAAKQA